MGSNDNIVEGKVGAHLQQLLSCAETRALQMVSGWWSRVHLARPRGGGQRMQDALMIAEGALGGSEATA
jgi:hypothetical protein